MLDVGSVLSSNPVLQADVAQAGACTLDQAMAANCQRDSISGNDATSRSFTEYQTSSLSGQRNVNGIGDKLSKDVIRFLEKMGSLEKSGGMQTGGSRVVPDQMGASSADGPLSGRGGQVPESTRAALEQAKRVAEYSSYLSATATLLQGAVGSAKRLQQG